MGSLKSLLWISFMIFVSFLSFKGLFVTDEPCVRYEEKGPFHCWTDREIRNLGEKR